MKSYPTIHNIQPRDHLLFDIGFSSALLYQAKELLQEIARGGDYPVAVDELLGAIEAIDVDRRLVALDKVIEAFDGYSVLTEPQFEALKEARKAVGQAKVETN
jgi:hypothetical protein